MNKCFEQIYRKNEWGNASGGASLPEHKRGYVPFLADLPARCAVQLAFGIGCSAWQFSNVIRCWVAGYHGLDVSAAVVEYNQKHRGGEKVNFTLYGNDPAALPNADPLIVKDSPQHLDSQLTHRALALFQGFKRVPARNCGNPRGTTLQRDIEDGDFRNLDLRLPPFGLQATEVYSFQPRGSLKGRLLNRPRWCKKVLLVEPRPAS